MGFFDVVKKQYTGVQGFADAPPEDKGDVGRLIAGRYMLEVLLCQGGMGKIFLGRNLATNQQIVVKTLKMDLQKGGDYFLHRFKREAEGMSLFSHPNIVAILDWNVDRQEPYIVMEYIEGQTMKNFIDQFPEGLPLFIFFSFMEQLCGALGQFHEKGIVHRDLKPANMMVHYTSSQYQVKILDLGLIFIERQMQQEDFKLTKKGQLVGTPSYMSPEQCVGGSVSSLSDIYSLGILAYELLTGRSPFKAKILKDVLMKQLNEMPKPAHLVRAEVSPSMGRVIQKALAKNPADRYAACADFWADLKQEKDKIPDLPKPLDRNIIRF